MTDRIDRRRFLAAGAGLVAAGWGATTACGSTKGAPTSLNPTAPFAVGANVFDFFSGVDQRVAVLLFTNDSKPLHPTGPVTFQIGPANGPLGAPETAALYDTGLPVANLMVRHHFETPGSYTIRVGYQGHTSDLPIQVVDRSTTQIPLAGRPLISVPTPTPAKPLGVDPICTAQPPCPLHAVSLDKSMAQHRRIALIFATPALCTSRLCGPGLDNLVAVHQSFADKVTFIHCEIYTDLSGAAGTPPVLAYHLQHEPMLLLAGTDGIVHERIDNAFDQREATEALTRLVAT